MAIVVRSELKKSEEDLGLMGFGADQYLKLSV